MTPTLRHTALPFSGPDGFVATAVGLIDDALTREAIPFLLHDSRCIAAVRDELGPAAAALGCLDIDIDGRNPARLLPALRRFVDEHPQREVCVVAEPYRPGAPEAWISEMQLHELLLYLPAFAAWNCVLTCAYDRERLDPDRAAAIESGHGTVPAHAGDEIDRVRARSLPARPIDSAELVIDRTTLGALRGFIQDRAVGAGLDAGRAHDLVYAVNEVVTNSLCHGEGRARVSVWTEGASIVCEVRDGGWIRDPLAGRIAPDPDRSSGRGLWLVNQLCDLVQLRSSPSGTTLRMYVHATG